jgi:hypothetical protein
MRRRRNLTRVVGYTFNADTYCVEDMENMGENENLPDLSEDEPKPIMSTDEAGDTPDHCCVCKEIIDNSWGPSTVEYAVEGLEQYVYARVLSKPLENFNLECLDAWHERLGQCIVDNHDKWMMELFEATREYDEETKVG